MNIRRLWLPLTIAMAACATTPGPAPVRAAPDQEFRLRAGQEARVDDLRLRFVRVTEDSRCPINARCIRAGSAKVEVELRAAGTPTAQPVLETPDNPRGATFGAYTVVVTELHPGLETNQPPPAYEAVFRVRRR